MKRRTLILAGLGGALALAGGGLWYRELGRPVRGAAAAADPLQSLMDRPFPDLEGRPHTLSSWQGRPMVINFWATWCPPCVKEMPDLDRLQADYPGATVIGIGIDTAANIEAFVAKVPVSYPLLVAGPAGIDMMRGLGNQAGGLPYTLLLDREGRVTRRITGQIDPQDLARSLHVLVS